MLLLQQPTLAQTRPAAFTPQVPGTISTVGAGHRAWGRGSVPGTQGRAMLQTATCCEAESDGWHHA